MRERGTTDPLNYTICYVCATCFACSIFDNKVELDLTWLKDKMHQPVWYYLKIRNESS